MVRSNKSRSLKKKNRNTTASEHADARTMEDTISKSVSQLPYAEKCAEDCSCDMDIKDAEHILRVIFRQQNTPPLVDSNFDNCTKVLEITDQSEISDDEHENAISLSTLERIAVEADKKFNGNKVERNLKVSVRKISEKRELNLNEFSTSEELAEHSRQRVQENLFLLCETYSDNSAFCENCHAMHLELEFYADKFAALAAASECGEMNKKQNKLFMDELEKVMKKKGKEMIKLTSDLIKLRRTNEELIKEKAVVERDMDDYKFLLIEEMKKRQDDISEVRKKLFKAQDTIKKMVCELKKRLNGREDLCSVMNRIKSQIGDASMQELLAVNEEFLAILKPPSNNEQRSSDERTYMPNLTLLEAKIVELQKIVSTFCRLREKEAERRKLYFMEKLRSILEKLKCEVKDNLYNSKWDPSDTICALLYFEAAIRIATQDIPKLDILIEMVAQQREGMKCDLEQCKIGIERILEEKTKWETLYGVERSKYDGLQTVFMAKFCENRKNFINAFQNLQKNLEIKMHSLTQVLSERQSRKNLEQEITGILKHLVAVQEEANKEWTKALKDLQAYVFQMNEESEIKLEIKKMSDAIATLQIYAKKLLRNPSTTKVEHNGDEQQQKQLAILRNELEKLKWEKAALKLNCEHGEKMQRELQMRLEYLQKTNEDLQVDMQSACKKLDFEQKSVAQAFRLAEKLTAEKNELANEIATLKNRLLKMEEKYSEWKEQDEDEVIRNVERKFAPQREAHFASSQMKTDSIAKNVSPVRVTSATESPVKSKLGAEIVKVFASEPEIAVEVLVDPLSIDEIPFKSSNQKN